MINFKVGDKVRIMSSDTHQLWNKLDILYKIDFVDDMSQYCGMEATIIRGEEYSWEPFPLYKIDLDNGFWSWSECIFIFGELDYMKKDLVNMKNNINNYCNNACITHCNDMCPLYKFTKENGTKCR